jgi:hypothetical protein
MCASILRNHLKILFPDTLRFLCTTICRKGFTVKIRLHQFISDYLTFKTKFEKVTKISRWVGGGGGHIVVLGKIWFVDFMCKHTTGLIY